MHNSTAAQGAGGTGTGLGPRRGTHTKRNSKRSAKKGYVCPRIPKSDDKLRFPFNTCSEQVCTCWRPPAQGRRVVLIAIVAVFQRVLGRRYELHSLMHAVRDQTQSLRVNETASQKFQRFRLLESRDLSKQARRCATIEVALFGRFSYGPTDRHH